MIEVKQVSRHHFLSEDEKTEIYVRHDGRKPNEQNFSGNWQFSAKHGDMRPHKDTYSISINGEIRVRDIFESEIVENLRHLGFVIKR